MFLFKAVFKPRWEDIAGMRKFLISLFSGKITNHDDAYRVALIVSELLENVCKYSVDGIVRIGIKYSAEKSVVSLVLQNRTTRKNLESFRGIYDEVFKDSPMESYRKMMLRSSDGRTITQQLGLARIRYEGRAGIRYTAEQDKTELPEEAEKRQNGPIYILKIQIATRVAPL